MTHIIKKYLRNIKEILRKELREIQLHSIIATERTFG